MTTPIIVEQGNRVLEIHNIEKPGGGIVRVEVLSGGGLTPQDRDLIVASLKNAGCHVEKCWSDEE